MNIVITTKRRQWKRFNLITGFSIKLERKPKGQRSPYKFPKTRKKYIKMMKERAARKAEYEATRQEAVGAWAKTQRFFREAWQIGVREITTFFRTLYLFWETVLLLIAASLGINFILSEIPFFIALPLWVEATMFFPLLAVSATLGLVYIAEKRQKTDKFMQLLSY